MRRIIILLFAVTAVALVVVTAPALSARSYLPAPVEAEIAAPGAGLGTGSVTGFVSEAVEAPIRFTTVGFNWTGGAEPEIAVRVRADGEPWGDWTPVPAHSDGGPDRGSGEGNARGVSQPVWAGEADLLQYRVSRRPRDLRLHFINTTGTATAADRAETALRGLVNDATVAVAGLGSAEAADDAPRMVTRREWGARHCKPTDEPSIGEVRAAFVHHTVTANTYTRDQAAAMVLGICRYHRDSQGWDDIGYQFMVDKYGRLYQGRAGGIGRAVIGVQVQGFNDDSTGIANLGTHTSTRQSRAALRATARLLRWKLPHHGQPTDGRVTLTSDGGDINPHARGTRVRVPRISGHRDVHPGATECPGEALHGQLPRLRRMSDVTPPDPPQGLTATRRGTSVRLAWRANRERDLRGYRVFRAKPAGGFRRIASPKRNGYRDKGRTPGRTYTYHVRAVDRRGNLSGPSNEDSATIARR